MVILPPIPSDGCSDVIISEIVGEDVSLEVDEMSVVVEFSVVVEVSVVEVSVDVVLIGVT